MPRRIRPDPTTGSLAAVKLDRMQYYAPTMVAAAIRDFMLREGIFDHRVAITLLLEGALKAYPRWGVRRGIIQVIDAEVRAWTSQKVRNALINIAEELQKELAQPLPEEMVEHTAEPEGSQ